jgi:ankyrin repeat protein
VRGILAELPETLDETYERILREIPKTNRVHAHRLLQCLTVAVRPLKVKELAEVLAINFDAEGGIPKLNEGFRWADQEQAILSACSSLVVIVEYESSDSDPDPDSNTDSASDLRRVQFSHFSVKEFLTSDRLAASTVDILRGHHILLEPAHTIMAQACLSVLLQVDDHMDKETILSYPLAKYAGKCFVDHAKFGDVLSRINDGLDDLLDPDKPHFNTWLWLYRGDWVFTNFVWNSTGSYRDEPVSNQSNSGHPVPIHPPRIFPLFYAVAYKFTCLAEHVLKRPRDLNASDKYGTTALHIAAYQPNCEVAQMLIERTAAINVRDNKGRTPLHYAMHDDCMWGWGRIKEESRDDIFHCVRLLLDGGASADLQNNNGSTPLHAAAASKISQEIVQLLIENSTNIDLRNNKGQTALHKASQRGQPDIIRLMINHGADVDTPDNEGSTPLHLAISEGSLQAVQLLLNHGASVILRNEKGQTALHRASERGEAEIIQLILDHNADVDALDNDGSTPLHLAISEDLKAFRAVQLLLEHGASVHRQNNRGETSLQVASARGLLEITELLSMHSQSEQMA